MAIMPMINEGGVQQSTWVQPQTEEQADSAPGEGSHGEKSIQDAECCLVDSAGNIPRPTNLPTHGRNSRMFPPFTTSSLQLNASLTLQVLHQDFSNGQLPESDHTARPAASAVLSAYSAGRMGNPSAPPGHPGTCSIPHPGMTHQERAKTTGSRLSRRQCIFLYLVERIT